MSNKYKYWRSDLTGQYARHKKEIHAVITRVLKSGRYILGNEGALFEKEFSRYVGCAHGVGVASGTDALILALEAVKLCKGDQVITTVFAPTPVPSAIIRAGGEPVFVDVDPDTALMDISAIEQRITARTRVIMPVHLFGSVCDMPALKRIARKHGLVIIEDASQAHGSMLHKKRAGSFGDLAAFSFYPTKNLGAYGDAGMVVTNSRQYAGRISLLRNYGKKHDPFNSEICGTNSRLDEIQAALLRVKLRYLDRMNTRRRSLVRQYLTGLRNAPVSPLALPPGVVSNYHVWSMTCPGARDRLRAYLEKRRIQTNVYYPAPLHTMKAFRRYAKRQAFPNASRLSGELIALPLYPEMTGTDVAYIVRHMKRFFGAGKRT